MDLQIISNNNWNALKNYTNTLKKIEQLGHNIIINESYMNQKDQLKYKEYILTTDLDISFENNSQISEIKCDTLWILLVGGGGYWIESEKETLHVLNGVSNLLDLTDKIGRVDSEKILKKLDEIQSKVEKLPKADQ